VRTYIKKTILVGQMETGVWSCCRPITIKSNSCTLNQAAHDFKHTRTHVKMLREERRELLSDELGAISVA